MKVDNVLHQRNETHGRFYNNARISQQLKAVIHSQDTWLHQDFEVREALDMICSKVSRILSGKHNELDNWTDIVGYATLAREHIIESNNFKQELIKDGHYE